MCGIFGFALRKPLPMVRAFEALQKLEVHQYPQEPRPVGGYGAGVAYLKDDGSVELEKVGAVDSSPSKCLSEIVHVNSTSVLIGHVRMPSPEFMRSAKYKETAQPFLAGCSSGLTIVSAHNGKMSNYVEVRKKLNRTHCLESEKVELIDSEVIPHFFEDFLKREETAEDALNELFAGIEGSNAISLLQVEEERMLMHFIHKGQTRGLHIWTNEQDELVFCSRKEPLMDEFKKILEDGRFSETVSVPYHKDENVRVSFTLSVK